MQNRPVIGNLTIAMSKKWIIAVSLACGLVCGCGPRSMMPSMSCIADPVKHVEMGRQQVVLELVVTATGDRKVRYYANASRSLRMLGSSVQFRPDLRSGVTSEMMLGTGTDLRFQLPVYVEYETSGILLTIGDLGSRRIGSEQTINLIFEFYDADWSPIDSDGIHANPIVVTLRKDGSLVFRGDRSGGKTVEMKSSDVDRKS
jgi:hypothetical protein